MEKEKDFISKFSELTEENQRYVVAVQHIDDRTATDS